MQLKVSSENYVTSVGEPCPLHRRIQACHLGGATLNPPSPPSPFPLSFPSFPVPLPSPFALVPLLSPFLPPSLPLIQVGGLGERCKCIFSIFCGTEVRIVSVGNNFARLWADKMSMETEKRTYLTVILPNCYSSEQVQHQALKLLFVHSQTIYIISHGANIH